MTADCRCPVGPDRLALVLLSASEPCDTVILFEHPGSVCSRKELTGD